MKALDATWAIVPLKGPDRSKTRLSPLLSTDECAGLAQAMASDVLFALNHVEQLRGIAVIGDDPWVRNFAMEQGCLFIEEPAESNLSTSLDFAAAKLVDHGASSAVILPGDLPCLLATDIEQLLQRHRPGITLCAAGRDGGTNALVCELPAQISFQFGKYSADKHCAAAKDRGISVQRLRLAAFSRDIDTPADLSWLVGTTCRGETRRFLERAGLISRLARTLAPTPATT